MNPTHPNQVKSEEGLHALDYWQVIRNRYPIILLAFLLLFGAAAAVTFILPREYVGRVQLEIHRQADDWDMFRSGAPGPGQNGSLMPLTFTKTQFEIIRSKKTLERVIEELDLMKRWDSSSDHEAWLQLRRMIELSQRHGTDLIDIQVYALDAELAADIANSIARAYSTRRMDDERQRTQGALDALKDRLSEQERKVASAKEALQAHIEQHGIIDLYGNSSAGLDGEPMSALNSVIVSSEQSLLKAQQEVHGTRTRLERLQDLELEEFLKQATALNLADNSLVELQPLYYEAQLSLRRQKDSGLGARHPDVLATENQISDIRGMLETSASNIRSSLETELEIAEANLTQMEQIHADKEGESIAERGTGFEYGTLQRSFQTELKLMTEMRANFDAESVDLLMPKTPIRIHEEASPIYIPARPNVKQNLVLGALAGLIFGLGLAFFLEYMDTTVKSMEDVERHLQIPVLSVVPTGVGSLKDMGPLTPDAEAYRILRTNLEIHRGSSEANSLTVVSGSPGEGKSTTLMNLAYVCAQAGYNTLVIDADLRRPRMHTFFDVSHRIGLANFLTDGMTLEQTVMQTAVDNLFFMPSGPTPEDASSLLNSQRMVDLLADVKSRFDLVLVDSPPILGVSDASVLVNEVDMTMVVIQHRKLPRNILQRVRNAAVAAGANVVGAVLNNVDVKSDSNYQYYTTYYNYYAPQETQKPRQRNQRPAPAAPGTPQVAPGMAMAGSGQGSLNPF